MKPETTDPKFPSLPGCFNPAVKTELRGRTADEHYRGNHLICLNDDFKVWYNNSKNTPPARGIENPVEMDGSELLSEMERVAGSRDFGAVVLRMSFCRL